MAFGFFRSSLGAGAANDPRSSCRSTSDARFSTAGSVAAFVCVPGFCCDSASDVFPHHDFLGSTGPEDDRPTGAASGVAFFPNQDVLGAGSDGSSDAGVAFFPNQDVLGAGIDAASASPEGPDGPEELADSASANAASTSGPAIAAAMVPDSRLEKNTA